MSEYREQPSEGKHNNAGNLKEAADPEKGPANINLPVVDAGHAQDANKNPSDAGNDGSTEERQETLGHSDSSNRFIGAQITCDIFMAIFTLVLSVVAILQWCQLDKANRTAISALKLSDDANKIAQQAVKAAEASADSASRAVKLAESHSNDELRAYVVVESAAMLPVPSGGTANIAIQVKNVGETPARDVTIASDFIYTDRPNTGSFEINWAKFNRPSKLTVGRDIGFTHPLQMTITADAYRKLRSGEYTLWIFGEIRYLDIFGKQQRTRYRFREGGEFGLHGGTEAFGMNFADEGNDAS